MRTAATETTAPISRFADQLRRSARDVSQNMAAYLDAASKNKAMERKIQHDKTKLIEAEAALLENKRLNDLLALVEGNKDEQVAVGHLISGTSTSVRRIAVLSVGSNDGVAPGQPVRAPDGLIGAVIEVGPNTAKVLLISDAENVLPVQRLPDGLPAFASGLGNGLVVIRPVDLGVNPFKKGDMIVTLGSGGKYPPNIPYAEIVRKTGDGAIARPLAGPANSPYVIVLKQYEPTARALLEKVEAEFLGKKGDRE